MISIDNILGAPPPEDTPNNNTTDPRKFDLACTPAETKSKASKDEVAVEYAGGTAYGKAPGLYNKHYKYSEQ